MFAGSKVIPANQEIETWNPNPYQAHRSNMTADRILICLEAHWLASKAADFALFNLGIGFLFPLLPGLISTILCSDLSHLEFSFLFLFFLDVLLFKKKG